MPAAAEDATMGSPPLFGSSDPEGGCTRIFPGRGAGIASRSGRHFRRKRRGVQRGVPSQHESQHRKQRDEQSHSQPAPEKKR